MTAGSVHNVNDYAPPGYKLAATHYADGKCTHVFHSAADPMGVPEIHCVVTQHEDEAKVLERFKADHAAFGRRKFADEPAADTLPSGNLTSEAAVRFADTLPAPAPKPAKRKGGNGG